MLKEFLQLFAGGSLLFVFWTADRCSEVFSLKVFTTVYVVVVYLVIHYDRP